MEKMAGWEVIPQSPPDGRSRHADLVTAEIPLHYKYISLKLTVPLPLPYTGLS
jgi:hypothetical protein